METQYSQVRYLQIVTHMRTIALTRKPQQYLIPTQRPKIGQRNQVFSLRDFPRLHQVRKSHFYYFFKKN